MPVVASAEVQTTPTTAPWSARTLLETSSLSCRSHRRRLRETGERPTRSAALEGRHSRSSIGAWALKATSGRTDVALFRPDDQDSHVSRAENTSRIIPGPQREQTQMMGSAFKDRHGGDGNEPTACGPPSHAACDSWLGARLRRERQKRDLFFEPSAAQVHADRC